MASITTYATLVQALKDIAEDDGTEYRRVSKNTARSKLGLFRENAVQILFHNFTPKNGKLSNVALWIKTGEAPCKIHGLHSNWRVSKNHCSLHCVNCSNRTSKLSWDKKDLIDRMLSNARNRKRDFNLDRAHIEELIKKQNNLCALSGLELDSTMSIDRIDSSKDYVKGNVQMVLLKFNRMKTDLPLKEFIEMCRTVANYKGLENV